MKPGKSLISTKPVTILLVEDDPGHSELIEMTLDEVGLNNPIYRVDNGRSALDFVYGTGEYETAGSRMPLVILLDLNLPVLNGLQVLKHLKSDERTRSIPIVILTTTQEKREIRECYRLGCNAYLSKPLDYDEFQNAILQLGLFMSVITVPDELSNE